MRSVAAALAFGLWLGSAGLLCDEEAGGAAPATLEEIRVELAELRFERALAAVDRLLARPDLADAERFEALVLRSQAHVATGQLDAAETDYRELLRLRPAFLPDAGGTPDKAMKRFSKARQETVSDLVLRLDPEEASLTVDGRPAARSAEGTVAVVAGSHVLAAEAPGFDAETREVVVDAGARPELELRLVPNARTIVVITEPAGAEIRLDGVLVGSTREESGSAAAALELPLVPPGAHRFEVSKPCFRTERWEAILAIDLLRREPERYGPIRLVPERSKLFVRGEPAGAEVRVDGSAVGRLPLEGHPLCPGPHGLELRLGSRTTWRSSESLPPGEHVVDVVARPNLVLVGERWPVSADWLEAEVNVARADRALAGDGRAAEHWDPLDLPPDTDLALWESSGARPGAVLYSPALRLAAGFDGPLARVARPEWSETYWGVSTADSESGGPAVVVRVPPDGPAAAAGLAVGARIVRVGGADVEGSGQLVRLLRAASRERPLEVEWIGTDGAVRHGTLHGVPSIRIDAAPGGPDAASILRAAWARVDAEAGGPQAAAAQANLAALLSRLAPPERAHDAWRRVRLEERRGIGAGTVHYWLGVERARLGDVVGAIEAFEQARRSAATAFTDDGPAIAKAASDRLADLGKR